MTEHLCREAKLNRELKRIVISSLPTAKFHTLAHSHTRRFKYAAAQRRRWANGGFVVGGAEFYNVHKRERADLNVFESPKVCDAALLHRRRRCRAPTLTKFIHMDVKWDGFLISPQQWALLVVNRVLYEVYVIKCFLAQIIRVKYLVGFFVRPRRVYFCSCTPAVGENNEFCCFEKINANRLDWVWRSEYVSAWWFWLDADSF